MDWELVCQVAASAAARKDCKVVQRLVAQEGGQSVFVMSALPAGQAGRYVTILSAPLGGYIAPGMLLTVDRGPPFKVLFETCNAGGCHGGFELSGRIGREMLRGKQLKVRLWTDKSKPVGVTVSLAGFDKAFAALKEGRS